MFTPIIYIRSDERILTNAVMLKTIVLNEALPIFLLSDKYMYDYVCNIFF